MAPSGTASITPNAAVATALMASDATNIAEVISLICSADSLRATLKISKPLCVVFESFLLL